MIKWNKIVRPIHERIVFKYIVLGEMLNVKHLCHLNNTLVLTQYRLTEFYMINAVCCKTVYTCTFTLKNYFIRSVLIFSLIFVLIFSYHFVFVCIAWTTESASLIWYSMAYDASHKKKCFQHIMMNLRCIGEDHKKNTLKLRT